VLDVADNWTLRKPGTPCNSWNVVQEKDGKISCIDSVKNEEVLQRVKVKMNIPHTTELTKDNWIGHILSRNCLLKHVTEGKIEGTVRRGRRRKQLLDDLGKEVK